jgi:hypothetical protein
MIERQDGTTSDAIGNPGMTLLDWLAGQALCGILANGTIAAMMSDLKSEACRVGKMSASEFEWEIEYKAYAAASYGIASAMLAARKEAAQ